LKTATTINRQPARDLRSACRSGQFRRPTTGHAPGFAQANLLVLPQEDAFDFLLFCQRNPKPCPLLEVTEPGDPEPHQFAPGADLRTDLPLYRVYREGLLVDEVSDVREFWRPDLVAFLLGCSFTFETALLRSGLSVRQLEETRQDGSAKNVPMYRTNIPCRRAGKFAGPLVVSMRPYSPADAVKATIITARYPSVHGAPIQVGDPKSIGIQHLDQPDWGDAVTIRHGEVPVFWACGVTPQAAVMESKPAFAIAHAPGHMFVTDVMDEELAG
jgi:uncharacterized protein YcsI (UPF0317 family)